MKFAVYYIPPPGGFYDLGSALVGYDIRRQEVLKIMEGFDKKWVKNCREYGFHITITDAVDIESEKLPEIEDKFRAILACFSPEKR